MFGDIWQIKGCPSILQAIRSNRKFWVHWIQMLPSGYGSIGRAGFLCSFVCILLLLYLLPVSLLSHLPLSYLPLFVHLCFSLPQSKWILIRILSSVSLCTDSDCPTKYHLKYCCLKKTSIFLFIFLCDTHRNNVLLAIFTGNWVGRTLN